MDNFILCGMQWGDESKGSFTDFLAHEENVECIVKYNGGSQASHTVITPNGTLHKFSQLGSGMFLENSHTYLTENMVVNPDNLGVEAIIFAKRIGVSVGEVLSRVHVHEDCFVVTPYHKFLNKIRELSLGTNRRGSVGTGVSEVRYLLLEQGIESTEPPLGLQMKDIFNFSDLTVIESRLKRLQEYVSDFYKNNEEVIWQNTPEELKIFLQKQVGFLLSQSAYKRLASLYAVGLEHNPSLRIIGYNLYNSSDTSFKNFNKVIFEGSQGLLLDYEYGIKPNTTYLDTTNHFALDLCSCKYNNVKIGIAKAFMSRHGKGVFPTESEEVSCKISDTNQEETFWNGKIRFGWFDAVLLRYAQKINKVDELYLSALDLLDDFETIKICNEYYYNGTIDDDFETYFEFYTDRNGNVLISNIKRSGEKLGKYLEDCTPKYDAMKGWKSDISHISQRYDLPTECLNYISMLEKLTGIRISVISVGPTRENKIRM